LGIWLILSGRWLNEQPDAIAHHRGRAESIMSCKSKKSRHGMPRRAALSGLIGKAVLLGNNCSQHT